MIFLREKAGEIKHLAHEVTILLGPAKIKYIADFRVLDIRTGKDLYVEAKGFANDRWPLKKKLYGVHGPGPLEIWGGHHLRPSLIETIIPRIVMEPCTSCETWKSEITDLRERLAEKMQKITELEIKIAEIQRRLDTTEPLF